MVSFGFFNSSNGDRKYSADDISRIFSYLITDGILATYGDKFFTTPSTSKLGVVLGTGWAWFNHTWTQSDTAIPFDVDEPDPSLDRFDAIYLKVDRRSLGRVNSLGLVKGTAAINPQKPTFPTETDVFYHPLAYVKVRHGVTRIAASDIEILCGKTQAPFITSILQTTDITTLFQGWSEQFGTKMSQWQTAYDTQMSNQQSGYTAKINEWEGEVDDLVSAGSQQMSSQQTQFSSKMTQWQNQFATQLTNQNTTFTTSLNGWEADFTEWFENLQTYLSQDVVTAIWADIEALKTKNTQQDTEIANKLNISAKATSSQMTNNTSGDYWVDPAQVHSKILADTPMAAHLFSGYRVGTGAFNMGTQENKVVQTNVLRVDWTNYFEFSSNGVIATPIGTKAYFLGWFERPNKFAFILSSSLYTKYAPTYISPEYADLESGTIYVRLIPVSETYVYLAFESRAVNANRTTTVYKIIASYPTNQYVTTVYQGSFSYGITTWKPMGFKDFLIYYYYKPTSSATATIYYIADVHETPTLKTTTVNTSLTTAYASPNSLSFLSYAYAATTGYLLFPFFAETTGKVAILRAAYTYNNKTLTLSSVLVNVYSGPYPSYNYIEVYIKPIANNTFQMLVYYLMNSANVTYRYHYIDPNGESNSVTLPTNSWNSGDTVHVINCNKYSTSALGPIIINNDKRLCIYRNQSGSVSVVHFSDRPVAISSSDPLSISSIIRFLNKDERHFTVDFPLVGNINSRMKTSGTELNFMGGCISIQSNDPWIFWFQVVNGTISFVGMDSSYLDYYNILYRPDR